MSNNKVPATYHPRRESAEETLAKSPMDELPIDPDCRDGKHRACLGETYDELLDKVVECGCPCHSDVRR